MIKLHANAEPVIDLSPEKLSAENQLFVIDPPETIGVPVAGSDRFFPVRNLYCVGRNYADHAVEMGGDPDREPPFFFIKPAFTVTTRPEIPYPALTSDLHHEVELAVAVGAGFDPLQPMSCVFGFAVAIDLTRRDQQARAKDKSRPWEASKTFPGAAPLGTIQPRIAGSGSNHSSARELQAAGISLRVNGQVVQSGNVNQMIWKIPEILARINDLFELAPGDLVLTGTPAGVGPLLPGDQVEAAIEGLPPLAFRIRSS